MLLVIEGSEGGASYWGVHWVRDSSIAARQGAGACDDDGGCLPR